MPQNKYWPSRSAAAAKRYGVPMRAKYISARFFCLFHLRALDSEKHAAGVYDRQVFAT
jgi:hypothetical protein